MKDHRLIDERSLAFDRLTAEKITANPALIGRAKANLRRWVTTASPRVRPVLDEWLTVLDGPRNELLALLVATDERANRLRQSSPFAGILEPAERAEILRRFTHRDASAA